MKEFQMRQNVHKRELQQQAQMQLNEIDFGFIFLAVASKRIGLENVKGER